MVEYDTCCRYHCNIVYKKYWITSEMRAQGITAALPQARPRSAPRENEAAAPVATSQTHMLSR